MDALEFKGIGRSLTGQRHKEACGQHTTTGETKISYVSPDPSLLMKAEGVDFFTTETTVTGRRS